MSKPTLKAVLRHLIKKTREDRAYPTPCEVLWLDAQGDEDERGDVGKLGNLGLVRSLGYLANIINFPPALVIASDTWRESNNTHTLRDTTTIPLNWLLSVRVFSPTGPLLLVGPALRPFLRQNTHEPLPPGHTDLASDVSKKTTPPPAADQPPVA